MGQQRGLDRLEELQRRARDQQDAEDDAGERGVGRGRVDRRTGAVEQRLLGEHDGERRATAKPPPSRSVRPPSACVDRARGRRSARLRAPGPAARRAATRSGAAAMPSATAACPSRCRRRRRRRTGSASTTRTAPARRRGRTAGGRPASRGRSSSRRRRATPPTKIQYSVAEPSNTSSSIGSRSGERDDEEQRARTPPGCSSGDAQRVAVGAARARGARRSCATAAARSAGR